MNNMISIIIPLVSDKINVENCFKSIISQDYTNFEVLCITENQNEVIKHSNNDRRFTSICKFDNISMNCNNALDVAKGDLILFIDPTHTLINTALSSMINRMNSTNSDVVICEYLSLDFKHYIKNEIIDLTNKDNFLQLARSTFTIGQPWNKLYKKDMITEKFNKDINFSEDNFGLANIINANKIAWMCDCLYNLTTDECNETLLFVNKENLYEESLKVLKRKLNVELASQVSYARVFDLIIWELLMLDKVGLLSENSQFEIKQAFKEKHFIDSLTCKEKYGVSYNPSLSYSNELIEKFIILCMDANQEIASRKLNLVPFNVTVCLFVKLFIVKNGLELNQDDLLANMYSSLDNNSTEEAKYVNQLIR